ncbi:unnamed protein product [Closterium sp. NIES-54]
MATPALDSSPQRGISTASGNCWRQASVRRRKQRCHPRYHLHRHPHSLRCLHHHFHRPPRSHPLPCSPCPCQGGVSR